MNEWIKKYTMEQNIRDEFNNCTVVRVETHDVYQHMEPIKNNLSDDICVEYFV